MTPRRQEPLTLGSLGRARFNEDTSRWEFPKSSRFQRSLHQISPTRALSAPILPPLDTDPAADYLERRKRINASLRREPELAPFCSTILRLTYTSEAIEKISPDYDPAVSELFAVGLGMLYYRFSGKRLKKYWKSFLAYPGGGLGESLCVTGFRFPQDDHPDTAATELPIPRLDLDNMDEWIGTAVTPIQQICASTYMIHSTSYVAARRSTGTSFFKPWAEGAKLDHKLRWRAGFISEIPISYTGGSEHIDVAFSLGEYNLVGILDASGHWNVFSMSADGYRLESTSVPRPSLGEHMPISDLSIKCDGKWGKLVFAGRLRGLVVCSRRDWGVFVAGMPGRRANMPDLGLLGEEDVILDLKRDPAHPQLIFLLTTSQLFWIRLGGEQEVGDPDVDIAPMVVISWHHHWDCTTFAVKLALSPEDPVESTAEGSPGEQGKSTLVMIYGKGRRLLEVYKTSLHADPFSGTSATDPFLINLRANESKSMGQGMIPIQLGLYDIDSLREKTTSGPHRSATGSNGRYVQLLELDARLGLSQTILFYSALQSPPPSLSLPPVLSQLDWDNWRIYLKNGIPRERAPRVVVELGSNKTLFQRNDARWLAERLYVELCKDFTTAISVNELARELLDVFQAPNHIKGGILLRDIVSEPLVLDDPEAAAEELDRFLPKAEGYRRAGSEIIVNNVLTPAMRELLTGISDAREHMTFSQVYDYMRRTWISSLPKDIPVRAKVTLDKYIRQLALEAFLCSVRLHRSVPAIVTQIAPQAVPSTSQPKGKSKISTSQPIELEQRPAYSPSTSLSQFIPIPPTLRDPTDVLARITDEWVVGADPTEYDWKRVRGIEGGELPPQQVREDPKSSKARAETDGDVLNTQDTVLASQVSQFSQTQSPSQSQSRIRNGKPKKKKRKQGF